MITQSVIEWACCSKATAKPEQRVQDQPIFYVAALLIDPVGTYPAQKMELVPMPFLHTAHRYFPHIWSLSEFRVRPRHQDLTLAHIDYDPSFPLHSFFRRSSSESEEILSFILLTASVNMLDARKWEGLQQERQVEGLQGTMEIQHLKGGYKNH